MYYISNGFFYLYTHIYPQWCCSLLKTRKSSAEKITHTYIFHKNNIATSVEQVALTLRMDLDSRPHFFPCCLWAGTDRSVRVLAEGLADYESTSISAQFNSLA